MKRTFRFWIQILFGLMLVGGAFMLPTLANTAGANSAASGAAQQPQPTAPASETSTSSERKRLEAPPLRPQAASLLIGINVLVAIAVILFAFYLRRRQQRQ